MQSIKTYIAPFIVGLAVALLLGILAGLFGSFLASVFFPSFGFGKAVGYEAGGILFFLFGLIVGGVYGTFFTIQHSFKLFSQKALISFTLIFYCLISLLWVGYDTFHETLRLSQETQVIILLLAWVIPPIFTLRKQKQPVL